MGFKIVLLGSDARMERLLSSRIDDLPWILVRSDVDFVGDSIEQVDACFERKHPSVVIALEPEAGPASPLYLDQLEHVSAVCVERDIPLIQLSSYEIFGNTDKKSAIAEADVGEGEELACSARNVELVASRVRRHIILRRSWLLDGRGSALLPLYVPKLMQSEPMVVSDHDFGGPVSSAFIADVLVALVKQILTGAENWGVFHLHSADTCSEAEFCDHLVRQLHKEKDLSLPLPSVSSKDDTRRFLHGNAHLSGRRITDNFGIQLPTWRRGFGRLLREWLAAWEAEDQSKRETANP